MRLKNIFGRARESSHLLNRSCRQAENDIADIILPLLYENGLERPLYNEGVFEGLYLVHITMAVSDLIKADKQLMCTAGGVKDIISPLQFLGSECGVMSDIPKIKNYMDALDHVKAVFSDEQHEDFARYLSYVRAHVEPYEKNPSIYLEPRVG